MRIQVQGIKPAIFQKAERWFHRAVLSWHTSIIYITFLPCKFSTEKKNSKEFLEKDSLLTSLDVSGSHWRDHGITLGADSSRVLWPFATSAMDLLRRFLRKGTFLAIFLLVAVLPRSLLIMLYIYIYT